MAVVQAPQGEGEGMRRPRFGRGALRSAFTSDWRGAALAAACLLMLVVLAALPSAVSRHSQLSAYDDGWDDISDFRADMEYHLGIPIEVRTVESSAAALDSIDDASGTLYLAVGVERPYAYSEWAAIARFQDRGGAVMVADDFGKGETLLRYTGDFDAPALTHVADLPAAPWLFSGARLADVRVDRNPLLVRVDVPVPDGRTLQLLLNDPSCFVENEESGYDDREGDAGTGEAEVLAWSSDRSWIDADRDGRRDPEEESGTFPVIVYEEGMLLLSDPSVFINDMYHRYDNREVLLLLVGTLLPRGGTVIIDESIHIEPGLGAEADDLGLRAALRALGQPWPMWPLLMVLFVMVAVAALASRRRPMRFVPHQDRLSERHMLMPGPMTLLGDYQEARALLLQRLRYAYGLDPAELPRLPPQLVAELLGDWNLARFALQPMPPDPVTLSAALVAIAAWTPPEGAGDVMAKVERYLETLEGRPRRSAPDYSNGGGGS